MSPWPWWSWGLALGRSRRPWTSKKAGLPRPHGERCQPPGTQVVTVTVTQELRRNYRVAFLRYLPRREEAPLRAAYEIGRSAVIEGITVLDLAELHHQVFLEVIQNTPEAELADVTTGASEFFLEVLATHDMTQRSLLEQQRPPPTGGD
jgi:hypothetical protein